MILVDANILLYAEDSLSEHHTAAVKWWDAQLSGESSVGLAWQVIQAFIRIGTNPRLHKRPLTIGEATDRVESWFDQPNVRLVQPGDKHWNIFRKLLRETKAVGNLVSDAHLAALALEHNCEMCSTDSDFAKFPALKWRNPIQARVGK